MTIDLNRVLVYGIIYKAVNKTNGFVYIGQTINTLPTRRRSHKRINSNSLFSKAVRKLGLNAFDWQVIDVAYNRQELNELEKLYIKKYNSLVNGYNKTKGGSGNPALVYHPIIDTSDVNLTIYKNPAEVAKALNENNIPHVYACCNYSGTGKRRYIKGHRLEWYYSNIKYEYSPVIYKTGSKLGLIHIYRGSERKRIESNLQKYLNDGWIKGNPELSQSTIIKNRKTKGIVYWVNNGIINRRVDKLEEYLKNGWKRGRKPR